MEWMLPDKDWLKVELSDESTFQQFRPCSENVRRPVGREIQPLLLKEDCEAPPYVIVWGSFDGSVRRGRLFFLPMGVSMNSSRGGAAGQSYPHLRGQEVELVPAGLGSLPCQQVHKGLP